LAAAAEAATLGSLEELSTAAGALARLALYLASSLLYSSLPFAAFAL